MRRTKGGQDGVCLLLLFFPPALQSALIHFEAICPFFVRPQAVATPVDIRIFNSQNAYLENESQLEDKGWRSVKTGDESPPWQRNRPRPVWSGPCQMVPQMNMEKKKEFWK